MNKSKKQKKMPGEFKPPKQKTRDEDKLYVQRPVGEQHRPNAPVKPPTGVPQKR
jgi:DnaJ family protein C protein 8